MKALTVRQPWAWAIAAGVKGVENRTRGTSYRGPLAIHAGKGWSVRGQNSPLILADWDAAVAAHGPGLSFPDWAAGANAFGAVIAVAELVDSHVARAFAAEPSGLADHTPCCSDRYAEFEVFSHDARDPSREVVHLVLRHVVALDEPVPAKGALGFWNLQPETDDAVVAQLRAGGHAAWLERLGAA